MTRDGQQPWTVHGLDDTKLELRVRERIPAGLLVERLVGSKGMARRVFAREQLRCAEGVVSRDRRLEPGELVTLHFCQEGDGGPRSGGALMTLYRDPILLAADKPAGLLVHGDGSSSDTLTARVRGMLAREAVRAAPQAVQRLDLETTGVVLFSLTQELQPRLDAQVAGHEMRKRYLAVVEGRLGGSERDWLRLDGPLARDRHDARRMRVGRTGKPSLTLARTLARSHGLSLLLVELGSGRRHQIRVHLAHAGHPLVGDTLYGGRPHADGLMLHAYEERLVHPATGEWLELRTAWPARFARLGFEEAPVALCPPVRDD